MKTISLAIIALLILYPSNLNFAQRNTKPKKNEIKKSNRELVRNHSPNPGKRGDGRRKGQIKIPHKPLKEKDGGKRKMPAKPHYGKKPVKKNYYPIKRKKPRPIEIEIIEHVIYEEVVIVEISPPSRNYCGGRYKEEEKNKILEYPYPNFPIRFLSAEAIYLYSEIDTNKNGDEELLDIYELNFSVKVRYNHFSETFGILIKYYDETEQLEIFNENEDILEEDRIYTFSKDIAFKYSGYLNLRIGYYDAINDNFYPENFVLNKTDRLIFVPQPHKQLIYNYE